MGTGMKERILKGAERLFFKHGYSGVRIDDIADAVGITKKTIYNHFPNKYALVQAVIETNVVGLLMELDAFACDENNESNSLDKIHRLTMFGYQEFSNLGWIFVEDKKSKYSKDLIEESLELIRGKIINLVKQYLDKGIKDKMIRSDVSKEILPYTVVIIVEGLFQLHRFPGIRVGRDELLRESIKMIYEGILTKKGKAASKKKWD